jgi:predicted Zn-dependent peptidase
MKPLYMLGVLMFISLSFGGVCQGVEKMTYENGLQTIVEKDASSPLVSVAVFVRVGAVDETPQVSGLSHFIEHLIFKGSKNFPGDTLSRNVENMGGYINAATSKEYTCYYINTQKNALEETVKMLADVTQNPNFPPEEIEKERKVVLEEIQRHFDDPQSVLYEQFTQTLYKKSAYRKDIIGTAKVIKSVTRDEILNYFKTHYIPQKTTVVVVGDVNTAKVNKLLSRTFGKLPKGKIMPDPLIAEPLHSGTTVTKKGNVEHAYMLSGFLGPDIQSPDINTADIALYILGGSRASRLYNELREKQKLVYSVSASFMSMKGTGAAYISSVYEPKNKTKVINAVRAEIDKIIKNGVTEDEVNRAKLSLKTDWNFMLETFSERAYIMGYFNVIGAFNVFENYIASIEAVTADDVKTFFKKYGASGKTFNSVLLPK